jgi:hypothetical protein
MPTYSSRDKIVYPDNFLTLGPERGCFRNFVSIVVMVECDPDID